jgi:hypothetical protein
MSSCDSLGLKVVNNEQVNFFLDRSHPNLPGQSIQVVENLVPELSLVADLSQTDALCAKASAPLVYASVLEYTSEEMRELTAININKIKDIQHKLSALKNAVIKMCWNDSLFDVTNDEFEGIQQGEHFEFPFIALYGLEKGEISHEEFFLIECYYGLRTQFKKEEIFIHPILNKNGSINLKTEKLMKECLLREDLCPRFFLKFTPDEGLIYQALQFSEEKFQKLIDELEDQKNSHEMIIFSTREINRCKKKGSPDIGEVIRVFQRFKLFYNDTWQFAPSLKIYELFLKNLFPYSQDVQLRARIDLTPNQLQMKRKEGHFDVLTPFPTCFIDEADGNPAPGLQGVYHDLFYHAVIVFGMIPEMRRALYTIAQELREFESKDDQLEDDNRHYLSNQILDSAYHTFLGVDLNALNSDFDLRIEKFKEDLIEEIVLDSSYEEVIEKLHSLIDEWVATLKLSSCTLR